MQSSSEQPSIDVRSALILAGGIAVPRLALGVFRAGAGSATRDAVLAALRVGYRHIDTAAVYGNEAEVGEAIRESGIPRDEVFVTTKLWNDDHGYDAALRACERSLAALGLDYLDLYLVHFPVPGNRPATWHAMEALQKAGRTRAIGVSNFMPRHLDELLADAEIAPAMNTARFTFRVDAVAGEATRAGLCSRRSFVRAEASAIHARRAVTEVAAVDRAEACVASSGARGASLRAVRGAVRVHRAKLRAKTIDAALQPGARVGGGTGRVGHDALVLAAHGPLLGAAVFIRSARPA